MRDRPSDRSADLDRRSELRRRAESAVATRAAEDPLEAEASDEVRRTLHELRVHQVELEMQNDELVRNTAELERSQERYIDLYDRAPVGFLMFDEAGVVMEANLTVAELLGVARDDLVGETLSRFVAPEDQDALYLHRRQLFEEGRPQSFELRMTTGAPGPVWVSLDAILSSDADGRPAGRASLVDRTESRRAEDALRDSRTLLRAIIDAAPEAIYAKDAEGRFVLSNRGAQLMVGKSEAETLGLDDRALFPPDEAAASMALDRQVLEATEPIKYEQRVTGADGLVRLMATTKGPLRDQQGSVVGLFVVAHDVTDARAAEEQARIAANRVRIQADAAREFGSIGIDTPGILEELVRRLGEELGDACVIQLLTEDRLELQLETTWAREPELATAIGELGAWPVEGDSGPTTLAAVVSSGVSLIVPVLTPERRRAAMRGRLAAAERFPVHSVIAVPLHILDGNVGIVILLRHRPAWPAFTGADLALVEDLAERAGIAISKIRIREQRERELAGLAAAQAALAESEARLRTVFDTMVEGVTVMSAIRDDDGRIVDFRIEYANSGIGVISRVPPDEQIGRTLLGLFPAHPTNGLFDAYVRVVETGVPFESGTIRYRDPDAANGPLDQILEHRAARLGDGYVLSVRDVTERAAAAVALSESRALIESILEATPDGIFAKDLEGRYVVANSGVAAIFGQKPADLLGRTDLELARPDADGFVDTDDAAMAAPAPITFDEAFVNSLGECRTFLTTKGALRDGQGHVTGVFGVARDVTERKAAEDEIRRLNEELEDRVRERTAELEAANRELETFSYTVSHDLRSPLRAITGFAEILDRRYRDRLDPKGRHYLENIAEGGRHMGVLIEELLEYSRLGRTQVHAEPVPLGPILDRLRTTLADRISASGGTLVTAEPLAVPAGDPVLLEQVLANLVENALTYHRPGVPPLVTVSAVRRDGRVTLSVADNGMGIAPEFQARVFEPFVRLHATDAYPGTGIGLATVRKAARLMGCEATLASAEGQGSTFALDLPAVPASAARGGRR